MSTAKISFESAIRDAEDLLSHFDAINQQPPPENAEVLKRAGLIMALTAWETYVEDRAREGLRQRLCAVTGSFVGDFIEARLDDELKRFHTPSADKTRKLFADYLGKVDVTADWLWNGTDCAKARKTLDTLIAKRGDAVHRSKPVAAAGPLPHLVKREDLEKAIKFFRQLVEATDKALAEN